MRHEKDEADAGTYEADATVLFIICIVIRDL